MSVRRRPAGCGPEGAGIGADHGFVDVWPGIELAWRAGRTAMARVGRSAQHHLQSLVGAPTALIDVELRKLGEHSHRVRVVNGMTANQLAKRDPFQVAGSPQEQRGHTH